MSGGGREGIFADGDSQTDLGEKGERNIRGF